MLYFLVVPPSFKHEIHYKGKLLFKNIPGKDCSLIPLSSVFKGEDILLRIPSVSSHQTTPGHTDGTDLKVQFEMSHRH
jgi:hypothetical protein